METMTITKHFPNGTASTFTMPNSRILGFGMDLRLIVCCLSDLYMPYQGALEIAAAEESDAQ